LNVIHSEKREGFDINFYAGEEDCHPRDLFMPEDVDQIINDINDGHLVWFVAKITASKNGIELASDSLGGCCYHSYMDFVDHNYYYAGMVNTVINEARQTIKELAA